MTAAPRTCIFSTQVSMTGLNSAGEVGHWLSPARGGMGVLVLVGDGYGEGAYRSRPS